MKHIFLGILLAFVLIGCGYKPTSYYAKSALGTRIYADVIISRQDPQNSVLIKDSINEAIVSRFGSRLVSKEEADVILKVKLTSVAFSPVVYDKYGYVIAYKTIVALEITSTKQGQNEVFQTSGEYDFSIEFNSVISDSKRFEAIRNAADDALDEFVSKVSIQGLYREKKAQ